MPRYELLGLYFDPAPVAEAITQIRSLGVPDSNVEVISRTPYKAEMLNRPAQRGRVGRIALVGAVLGILGAGGLTVGIYMLYTLNQGGQPSILPVPPSLIILFETTMLGTMLATFIGFLLLNNFPRFNSRIYDPLVTEGHIGVVARADEPLATQVEEVLNRTGAHAVRRVEVTEKKDYRSRYFWGAVVVVPLILLAILGLFVYDIIRLPIPSQMVEQESLDYQQGPRLGAPAGSVPVQGSALIAGQPASEPVPADENSLQRGQILYNINCTMCHGVGGAGNGSLASHFTPPPADLTDQEVQGFKLQELFMIITQGRSDMPGLSENLSPTERWDVVNFIRSLGK